jgi:hypothetical protein
MVCDETVVHEAHSVQEEPTTTEEREYNGEREAATAQEAARASQPEETPQQDVGVQELLNVPAQEEHVQVLIGECAQEVAEDVMQVAEDVMQVTLDDVVRTAVDETAQEVVLVMQRIVDEPARNSDALCVVRREAACSKDEVHAAAEQTVQETTDAREVVGARLRNEIADDQLHEAVVVAREITEQEVAPAAVHDDALDACALVDEPSEELVQEVVASQSMQEVAVECNEQSAGASTLANKVDEPEGDSTPEEAVAQSEEDVVRLEKVFAQPMHEIEEESVVEATAQQVHESTEECMIDQPALETAEKFVPVEVLSEPQQAGAALHTAADDIAEDIAQQQDALVSEEECTLEEERVGEPLGSTIELDECDDVAADSDARLSDAALLHEKKKRLYYTTEHYQHIASRVISALSMSCGSLQQQQRSDRGDQHGSNYRLGEDEQHEHAEHTVSLHQRDQQQVQQLVEVLLQDDQVDERLDALSATWAAKIVALTPLAVGIAEQRRDVVHPQADEREADAARRMDERVRRLTQKRQRLTEVQVERLTLQARLQGLAESFSSSMGGSLIRPTGSSLPSALAKLQSQLPSRSHSHSQSPQHRTPRSSARRRLANPSGSLLAQRLYLDAQQNENAKNNKTPTRRMRKTVSFSMQESVVVVEQFSPHITLQPASSILKVLLKCVATPSCVCFVSPPVLLQVEVCFALFLFLFLFCSFFTLLLSDCTHHRSTLACPPRRTCRNQSHAGDPS